MEQCSLDDESSLPCTGVQQGWGGNDNTVRLWKISYEGQVIKRSEEMVIRDFLGWTFCVAWSPTDPMEFATGSIDGYVCYLEDCSRPRRIPCSTDLEFFDQSTDILRDPD